MRWGFPRVKHSYVINARNMSSSYWRGWFSKPEFRCLVSATSFSEHHPTEKFEGRKAAAWFAFNGDEERPPFACAGLWRPWSVERKKGEDGDFNLCAFLTTEPNSVVAPIHPKAMPVILDPSYYNTRLSAEPDEIIQLPRPIGSDIIRVAFVGGERP